MMTGVDGLHTGDRPEAPVWGVDEATLRWWTGLTPGTTIQIVKRSAKHDGEERARYPGTVIAAEMPAPWVLVEAQWTYGRHAQAGLTFETGDILYEVFSPIHPYNAFAVHTPAGALKGWYANVDWPAVLERDGDDLALVWNDLYVDIIGLPNGTVAVLDEDELEDSGLAARDAELHARILTARDELLARFHERRPPFCESEIKQHDTNR